MSIELSLESDGFQQARRVIEMLSGLGSSIKAVELHSRKRADGTASNAEILEWLKNTNRDFATASSSDMEKISKAATDEIERRVGKEISKGAVLDVWNAKQGAAPQTQNKFASELAAAMFIAAMKIYMAQVSERIDSQTTNEPPFNSELNENYADQKEKEVGFVKPIGKKSGQLLDNLNPDGLGARNIRLRK